MKDILNEVIERLSTRKSKYCRIKHKRGWLEYLDDGDLIFAPSELHVTLRDVIDTPDNMPRGEKLFSLHRKLNFTMKKDKSPYRLEEALERFIIVSNPDNFYNQVPIGGGKESIDIGIEENDSRFVFVELKPWRSMNSPFYAIVQSLKNLIEYRLIHEFEIKRIPRYNDVELCILAPEEYYQTYGLIDSHGRYRKEKLQILKTTLNRISSEFHANLSIMALQLEISSFLGICRKLYESKGITEQSTVSVSRKDTIPSLAKNKWIPLVASG